MGKIIYQLSEKQYYLRLQIDIVNSLLSLSLSLAINYL